MANEADHDSKEKMETAESGEENENSVVLLSDLIKEQDDLEKESIALYGASDEKYCSYDDGYLKRQALFACLTCSPGVVDDLSKAAGICLACSFKCHESCQLVELYTKRNFRCDCGTKKMLNSCNLTKTKEGKLPVNRDNRYNHNFQGLYCTCNRPYPDPENDNGDDGGDTMVQCTICEDWFHHAHLNATIPETSDYDLVCELCLKNHEFLQYYNKYSVKIKTSTEGVLSSDNDDKLKSTLDKSISDILNIESENQPMPKKAKLDISECVLPTDKNGYIEGSIFLQPSWRDFICECTECKNMYNEQKLEFLLDPDDSQRLYEEKGFTKDGNALEHTIQNLSPHKRVAMVETIHEFQNMADKLKEFLIPFVGSKKVVTQDDINRFFEEMKKQAAAKSKLQPSTFCR